MNERIKELAHKAEFIDKLHNGDEWRWGYIDPELSAKLEKFAELIIGECAGIVEDAVDHREPASTYVGKIKEHFGVEELEEDSACPLCGEDSGTTCGIPGCQY